MCCFAGWRMSHLTMRNARIKRKHAITSSVMEPFPQIGIPWITYFFLRGSISGLCGLVNIPAFVPESLHIIWLSAISQAQQYVNLRKRTTKGISPTITWKHCTHLYTTWPLYFGVHSSMSPSLAIYLYINDFLHRLLTIFNKIHSLSSNQSG